MKNSSRCLAFRSSDAFVPAAFGIASVVGYERAAMRLYACCFAIHALSLFSSHGVRIAFARQPSIRQVRGSVKCALALQLTGAILMSILNALACRHGAFSPISMIVAGFLLNMEHTLYEYLFAVGDGWSASMCHFLTSIFLLTGFCMSGKRIDFPFLPAFAMLSALVALTISIVMGDGAKGRVNACILRCLPRAAFNSTGYVLPAALCAALLFPSTSPSAFFSGLTLYELCRTPYRRTGIEAPFLNRALLSIVSTAVTVLVILWKVFGSSVRTAFSDACGALIFASACSFVVFGSLSETLRLNK